MNYHDIEVNMLNGEGIRVILFVSGCTHACPGCHNPETWATCSGIKFDENAKKEIIEKLEPDYISGLTLSGGDPLHENNLRPLLKLVNEIKSIYGDTKDIWIYTGYTLEELQSDHTETGELRMELVKACDILVDGPFIKDLLDVDLPYRGSTNQRIIEIAKI